VIGGLVLHESLGTSLLVGAALVIVGVYLVNRRQVAPVRSRLSRSPRP
jgi:drug/metabolite transporter (DMT)-like permease